MWLKMGISFIFVLTSNLIGLDRKLVKRENPAPFPGRFLGKSFLGSSLERVRWLKTIFFETWLCSSVG